MQGTIVSDIIIFLMVDGDDFDDFYPMNHELQEMRLVPSA